MIINCQVILVGWFSMSDFPTNWLSCHGYFSYWFGISRFFQLFIEIILPGFCFLSSRSNRFWFCYLIKLYSMWIRWYALYIIHYDLIDLGCGLCSSCSAFAALT